MLLLDAALMGRINPTLHQRGESLMLLFVVKR